MTGAILPMPSDLPEPGDHNLAGELERLAGLYPIQYDRERKSAAHRLGIRTDTLDKEVNARRSTSADELDRPPGFSFDDVEPWPKAVAGAGLLESLTASVQRYLILPTGAAEAIALWVVHTHTHDTAQISPLLAITSPTPACGKTTLLSVLQHLVPKPMPASNITGAALFRSIEKWRPTLLIDEADTFIGSSEDLKAIINSGHNRSNAFVVRTVGDDHEPRPFATWAPKAIALIGKLPAATATRAINIELRRARAAETVERFRSDRVEHLAWLGRMAARWVADNRVSLRSGDPSIPVELYGRAEDNWRHLLAIADAAGGDWPERARRAAVLLSGNSSEDTAGIMLLADLSTIFAAQGKQWLSSTDIVASLGTMEDRPWVEWRNGNPITTRQLAKLVAPFKIMPVKRRVEGYTAGTRGYELSNLKDAFSRYLPDPEPRSATAPQTGNTAVSEPSNAPHTKDNVADTSVRRSSSPAVCGAVALAEPETWEAEV